MLELHVFPPALGLKSPSPFSMKAIALLQMSGLDYTIVSTSPRKAPRKKLPVLVDGTTIVADSTHIQQYLKNAHGVDLDKSLDPKQLAIAQAFRRLLEEHLYWVVLHSRWIEHPQIVREAFFSGVPAFIRGFVFNKIQKKVRASLYEQGMGRHSVEQIHAFGTADIAAISTFLDNKTFFFGDTPTSFDASLFGAITATITPPVEDAIKTTILQTKNLVEYHQRCRAEFAINTI